MEVDKSVVNNSQENFLIVASYINDITSTYYDDKVLDELHRDILSFCTRNKPVLLIDDLNGRTGTLNDIYDDPDAELCSPIQHVKPSIKLPLGNNCDIVINLYGEKISFATLFILKF